MNLFSGAEFNIQNSKAILFRLLILLLELWAIFFDENKNQSIVQIFKIASQMQV
jgi:hypothetical protein